MITLTDLGSIALLQHSDGTPDTYLPKNRAEVRLHDDDRISIRLSDNTVFNFEASEVLSPGGATPADIAQAIAEILNVDLTTIGGGGGTSDTTEATQLQVLSELQTINMDLDILSQEATQLAVLAELQVLSSNIPDGIAFKQKVQANLVPGWQWVSCNGYRLGVTITVEQFMWPHAINDRNWLTAATATVLQVSSTSNDDTNLGPGAWEVMVKGLNENYEQVTEYVLLNGQTPVNTVNQYTRVSYFHVRQSNHASRSNVGTLYIGSGTVTAGVNSIPEEIMLAGASKHSSAIIHVPAGFVFIMDNAILSAVETSTGSTRAVKTNIRIRRDYPGVYGATCRHLEVFTREITAMPGLCPTLYLVGPAAVYATTEAFVTNANQAVTAIIEGFLYDLTP